MIYAFLSFCWSQNFIYRRIPPYPTAHKCLWEPSSQLALLANCLRNYCLFDLLLLFPLRTLWVLVGAPYSTLFSYRNFKNTIALVRLMGGHSLSHFNVCLMCVFINNSCDHFLFSYRTIRHLMMFYILNISIVLISKNFAISIFIIKMLLYDKSF